MRKLSTFICALILGLSAAPTSLAIPRYLQMYRDYPFSLPELRNQCTVCHLSPEGGGPRNEFGKAFVKEDHLITENLRANHPTMFLSKDRALVDDVEVIFSDPENKWVLLRKGAAVYRVDVATRQVRKLEAPDLVAMNTKLPEPIPQSVIDESRAKMPEPVYSLPFDDHLVNLPTTRTLPKGAVSIRFTHRFTSPTFNQSRRFGGPFDVFGLDSTAWVGYGVSYGLTRRVSIGVYRARFDYNPPFDPQKPDRRNAINPIEFNADVNIFQEGEGKYPFSLVARASIEGTNFFDNYYRPNLQFMIGRSLTKYAEFYLVPTISFNTNPYTREEHPNEKHSTVVLGLGTAIRPIKQLPRLAFVGEFAPRVWGYTSGTLRIPNNYLEKPMASFGLQYRTYRHAFTLVVTNARGTTTSAYGQGANGFSTHPIDAFSLGFNISRQLR